MPLIKIDDKVVEAPQGETILRVALKHGCYIPYYCYHPALSVVGQCRMCLVEVKGAPKLLTACSTTVVSLPPDKKIDGKYDMVVVTKSKEVKKAQEGVLEFLLLNHPLDCPICDQAGECQLQEYSYRYGAPSSRFEFEKIHAPKRVEIGPHLIYDAERCIKCTRCVRFCQEIPQTGELSLVERGAHTLVDAFPGRALDNPYSVCTADICPVGALTSKEFRFKERVWFLVSANSVCPECSRGCSARFDSYKGEILRLVPRDNPKVNGPWMCDYGRLLSERLRDRERLDRPAFIEGKHLSRVPWNSFAPKLVEKYAFHKGAATSAAALILSGKMTMEEMVAFRFLSAAFFGGAAGTALCVNDGDDDHLLVRKEKRPNLEGARRLGIQVAPQGTLISGLLKGKKVAFIVREDIVGMSAGAEKAAVEKALQGMELVIVADECITETARFAHALIPLSAWHEMEGTTVNFQGIMQKMARVTVPPRDRRPLYEAVSLWLGAEGMDAPAPNFSAWFSKVKEAIPEIADSHVRDLLPHGIQLGKG